MTTKPKTRKAPAKGAELDPVFAAIAEHKRLIKESNRLEKAAKLSGLRRKRSTGNGYWRQNEGSGREKRSFPRFTIDGTVPAVPSARWPFAWPGLFR
jgi:hypothetical protein